MELVEPVSLRDVAQLMGRDADCSVVWLRSGGGTCAEAVVSTFTRRAIVLDDADPVVEYMGVRSWMRAHPPDDRTRLIRSGGS